MKKKLIIFNTFGFSVKELEALQENQNDIKLEEVRKQVKAWSYFERIEYLEELAELFRSIEKKGLNTFSKDDKKKIVMEIKRYVKTDNTRLAEDHLWALKKEIETGELVHLKK